MQQADKRQKQNVNKPAEALWSAPGCNGHEQPPVLTAKRPVLISDTFSAEKAAAFWNASRWVDSGNGSSKSCRNPTDALDAQSLCIRVREREMPSGTEGFQHNATAAAAEREAYTQGWGPQGSVCVSVCEGHYSCGPCTSTQQRWMAFAQTVRHVKSQTTAL